MKSIDVSAFDTSRVTDMGGMFEGCSSLESLDLSSFEVPKVANIKKMFCDTEKLQVIYTAAGADWSRIEKGSDVFSGCGLAENGKTSGEYAKVAGGYFTAKAKSSMLDTPWLSDWFYNADAKTKTLTLFQYFGTNRNVRIPAEAVIEGEKYGIVLKGIGEVGIFAEDNTFPADVTSISVEEGVKAAEDIELLFYNCGSLTSLDLSGLDTAKTINMSYLFRCCWSLESLDLTGLDMSRVNDMSGMFQFCTHLTELNI